MENFTWIPFYKELAQKLLAYKDKQNELIDFLEGIKNKKIPSISLNDKDENGKSIKLSEIDPFTFYATFNRGITDINRVKILKDLKVKFNIQSEIPKDFSGIPVVNNMQSWFFAYKNSRDIQDIPLLWELFEKAVSMPNDIPEDLFNRVLTVKCVSITNLSMGLFWINPEKFAALDGKIKQYLLIHNYSYPKVDSFKDYKDHLQYLNEYFPTKTFYELSVEAWNDSQELKNPKEEVIPSD